MQRLRAFTLVELLIVVSILAMLTSLSIPLIQRARQQAKNAVIQNFLQDVQTCYTRMKFGAGPDYQTITNAVLYEDFVVAAPLKGITFQLTGEQQLQIEHIPPTVLKTGAQSLQVIYGNPVTYNGLGETEFLDQNRW